MARRTSAAAQSEFDLPAAIWVPLEKLKPWVKNPRKNDHAVDDVCASIKRYGFGAPLVARKDNGEIIAGHTRLKAAFKLKLTHVPVRYLDLTDEMAHELALVDNKSGEKAAWDDTALLELLKQFAPSKVTELGWSDKDMAALERAAKVGGELKEDEPPDLPSKPLTELGDVWQLGRHRLICGDCTDPAVVAKLLGDRKVGLYATDPPYGVEVKTGTRGRDSASFGKGAARQQKLENDELTGAELEDFLRSAFSAAAPSLASGAAWYVWLPGGRSREFIAALEVLGGYRHQLVWVKSKFVMSRCDYHYRHEPCLYGWMPPGAHVWLGGRAQSTVFELKLDKAVGELRHPSVKPVELWAIPIRNHLGADGALLDSFAGTGPAFSAAEQLDRTCYGLELSPAYCDVIVERWENLTGGKARRSSAAPPATKKAVKKQPKARARA